MKTIKIDLPQELESIELIDLADFHLGDAMADWDLIQALIRRVKENDNCFCILGGDLMDTAISSSVGDTYGANIQPMEQLKMCVKLFEPIKDKILCVLNGNHENRLYKQDGVDLTSIMAAQLGLIDRYTETTAVLFIRVGTDTRQGKNKQQCYSVYVTHGTGAGRKEGAKINRLADYSAIVDADVYICGHSHLPAVLKEGFFRVDKHSNCVQHVSKLYVNTASSLKYGGYGDKAGMKPTSNDYPIIRLDGRKHKATAVL